MTIIPYIQNTQHQLFYSQVFQRFYSRRGVKETNTGKSFFGMTQKYLLRKNQSAMLNALINYHYNIPFLYYNILFINNQDIDCK